MVRRSVSTRRCAWVTTYVWSSWGGRLGAEAAALSSWLWIPAMQSEGDYIIWTRPAPTYAGREARGVHHPSEASTDLSRQRNKYHIFVRVLGINPEP